MFLLLGGCLIKGGRDHVEPYGFARRFSGFGVFRVQGFRVSDCRA